MKDRCNFGVEAAVVFSTVLLIGVESSLEEEESCGYSSFQIDEMNASELLEAVRSAIERLRNMGFSEKQIRDYCVEKSNVEAIRITKNYRIFISDRDNKEICMKPLVKSLFILFLKHPEGISFKDLSMYEKELLHIYGKLSGRSDNEQILKSIKKMIDCTDNSVNVARSRISKILSYYFNEPSLSQYVISGRAGQKKQISLDRELVIWE